MGKTTLAATFPSRSLSELKTAWHHSAGMDVQAFPVARSFSEVMEQIAVLAHEEHDFKTLVIDSITQLNTIIEKEIVESEPNPKTVACLNAVVGMALDMQWPAKCIARYVSVAIGSTTKRHARCLYRACRY